MEAPGARLCGLRGAPGRWACWVVLWAAAALAQTPPGRLPLHRHGPEELGSLMVRSLAQDAHGFLWVGTSSGLYRYDGRRFESIDMAGAFQARFIKRLAAGRGGDVWCLTVGEAARWHQGRWVPLKGVDPPRDLLTDGEGWAWLATRAGLLREQEGGHFLPVPDWPGGEASTLWLGAAGEVFAAAPGRLYHRDTQGRWRTWEAGPRQDLVLLGRDTSGHLWLAGDRSLWALEVASGVLREHPAGARGLWVRSAIGQPQGLLLSTSQGLKWLREDGRLSAEPGLSVTEALMMDRDGSLWLGEVGLYQVEGRGQWRQHTRREGLPQSDINGLHRDRRGRLWVGTRNGGLARGTAEGWEPVAGLARSTYMTLVSAEDGTLWLGGDTQGSILHYNPETASHSAHLLEGRRGNEAIFRLTFDREGALWAATSAGAYRAERPEWRFRHVPLEGAPERAQVFDLLVDSAGRLWLTSEHGLFLVEAGRQRHFTTAGGLRQDSTNWLAEDWEGRVCVTYRPAAGLGCFRYEGGALRESLSLDSRSGLTSEVLYFLGRDSQGRVWMGSDRGVDVLSAEGLLHFGAEDGLPGENCNAWSFWADEGGEVWVGTTEGLGHFRPRPELPPPPPPRVVLQSVLAGGQPLPSLQGRLELEGHRDTLELGWAVPSFLARGRVETQVRLVGSGIDWREEERRARFVGLGPGTYVFEARARRPGGRWGPSTRLELVLLPRWWQTWWVRLGLVLGGAGLVALAVGWRQRALLRRNEELERLVGERTRELREAQERVVYLEKTATEQRMAGGFAHEMRNVLTGAKVLLGGAQSEEGRSLCADNSERLQELFLRLRPHLPAEERRALVGLLRQVNEGEERTDTVLREVDAALDRALRTTDLILDYARTVRERPGTEPVAVGPVVESILAESRQEWSMHGIEVEVRVEHELCVAMKEAHLYSLVKNLVLNARDALREGPAGAARRLRVEARQEHGQVVLVVEDTGTGIAPGLQALVFEPFFTTKARGGTGLGLSTVQRLVGLYGGTIHLESTPGQGTRFLLRLPQAAPVTG